MNNSQKEREERVVADRLDFVVEWLNAGGGAAEFHCLGPLTLSTLSEGGGPTDGILGAWLNEAETPVTQSLVDAAYHEILEHGQK